MDHEQKLCLGYKEALTQLRLHPTIIWTRNNFFLLVQSGLLAFTLNIERQPVASTRLLACIAGLLLAFAWLWVNWAGRRLQRQWRSIVLKYETELFDQKDGEEKVIGPFHHAIEMEGKSIIGSVTSMLMALSTLFIFLWIVLLIRIYR